MTKRTAPSASAVVVLPRRWCHQRSLLLAIAMTMAFALTPPSSASAFAPIGISPVSSRAATTVGHHRTRAIGAPLAPAAAAPSSPDADGTDAGAMGGGGGGDGLLSGGSRRDALRSLVAASASTLAVASPSSPSALAIDVAGLPTESAAAPAPPPVEMKTFVDPEGYFAITVPKRFYALRRRAKGDLPDEKTGQGRRGSSIFTAGDMAKAEVVAVERFPVRVLLEEAGVTVSEGADLSTIAAIGKPGAVAELLNLRRDRDKPGQGRSAVVKDSVSVSNDGRDLTFAVRAQIDVQKPELLMEQMGVTELFRDTVAKATLEGNDGNMMVVFASALEQDFVGPDGDALRRTVEEFRALQPAAAKK